MISRLRPVRLSLAYIVVAASLLGALSASAAPADACAASDLPRLDAQLLKTLDRQAVQALLHARDEVRELWRSGYADDGKSIQTPFTRPARERLAQALQEQLKTRSPQELIRALENDGPAALFPTEVQAYRQHLADAERGLERGRKQVVTVQRETAEVLFLLRATRPLLVRMLEGGQIAQGADLAALEKLLDTLVLRWLEAQREVSQLRRILAMPSLARDLILTSAEQTRWKQVFAGLDESPDLLKPPATRVENDVAAKALVQRLAQEALVGRWESHAAEAAATLTRARTRLDQLDACLHQLEQTYLRLSELRELDFPRNADTPLKLRVRLEPLDDARLNGKDTKFRGSLSLVVMKGEFADLVTTSANGCAASGESPAASDCKTERQEVAAQTEVDLGITLTDVLVVTRSDGTHDVRFEGGGVRPNFRVDPLKAASLLRVIGLPPELGVTVHGLTFDLAAGRLDLEVEWRALPSRARVHTLKLAILMTDDFAEVRRDVLNELQRVVEAELRTQSQWLLDAYGLEVLEDIRFKGAWAEGVYEAEARVHLAALDAAVVVPVYVDLKSNPAALRVGAVRPSAELTQKLRGTAETFFREKVRPLVAEHASLIDALPRTVELRQFELVPRPGAASVRITARLAAPGNVGPEATLTLSHQNGRLAVDGKLDASSLKAWVEQELQKAVKGAALSLANEAQRELFGMTFVVARSRGNGYYDLDAREPQGWALHNVRIASDGVDLSQAQFLPGFEVLVQRLVPLPKEDVRIEHVRFSNRAIHFDVVLPTTEWGDIPLGSFAVGPTERRVDLDRARQAITAAIARRLSVSEIVLPGLGALTEVTLDPGATVVRRDRLDLWFSAVARVDAGGSVPLRFRLPKLDVKFAGNPVELLLQNLTRLGLTYLVELSGGKFEAEGFANQDGGRWVVGLRAKELKFALWVFDVTLKEMEISTRGVRLPSEYAARFGTIIPIATTGFAIAKPGVGYSFRTDAFKILGDLTFTSPGAEKLLKIDSSLNTNWRAASFELRGALVLVSILNLMEVAGKVDLRQAAVTVDGRTTGPLARLVQIEGAAELLGRQGRITANGAFRVFGISLLGSHFRFNLKPRPEVEVGAKVDLPFVASAEAGATASLALKNTKVWAKAALSLGGWDLAGLGVGVSLYEAKVAFRVLGIKFSLTAPSILSLTPGFILDAILAIFDIKLENVLNFLKNVLKGEIHITVGKTGGTREGAPRASEKGGEGSGRALGEGDPIGAPEGDQRPAGHDEATAGKQGPVVYDDRGKGIGPDAGTAPILPEPIQNATGASSVIGVKGSIVQQRLTTRDLPHGWMSIEPEGFRSSLAFARRSSPTASEFKANAGALFQVGSLSIGRKRRIEVRQNGGMFDACVGGRCTRVIAQCPSGTLVTRDQDLKRRFLSEAEGSRYWGTMLFARKVNGTTELWAVESPLPLSPLFGDDFLRQGALLGFYCAEPRELTEQEELRLGLRVPEPVAPDAGQSAPPPYSWRATCQSGSQAWRATMPLLQCERGLPGRKLWPLEWSCGVTLEHHGPMIWALWGDPKLARELGTPYARCEKQYLRRVHYESARVECRSPTSGQTENCLDVLFAPSLSKVQVPPEGILPAGVNASNLFDRWATANLELTPFQAEAFGEWVHSFLDAREPPTTIILPAAGILDGLPRPELGRVTRHAVGGLQDVYRFAPDADGLGASFTLRRQTPVWSAMGGEQTNLETLRLLIHKARRWNDQRDANLVPLVIQDPQRIVFFSASSPSDELHSFDHRAFGPVGYNANTNQAPVDLKERCEAERAGRLVVMEGGRITGAAQALPGTSLEALFQAHVQRATGAWRVVGRPVFAEAGGGELADRFVDRLVAEVSSGAPRDYCSPATEEIFVARAQEGTGFGAVWGSAQVTFLADRGARRDPLVRRVSRALIVQRWRALAREGLLEPSFVRELKPILAKSSPELTAEEKQIISELLSVRDLSWRQKLRVHPLYLVTGRKTAP